MNRGKWLVGVLLIVINNLGEASINETSSVPFYIYNAATEFKIDVALMQSICMVESNCRSRAINHDDGNSAQKAAGVIDKSYGLFQIKLATAQSLGFVPYETVMEDKIKRGKLIKVKKVVDHTKDLLKPEVNSWYAAKLLRHLYKRYRDTDKVLSAYNAGRYTTANKDYVLKVLTYYARMKIDVR